MSTRDLIDAIESGSATDIQTAFEGEMASRIAERLDTMRQEVSKNMFNEARKVSSKMAEDDEDDEDEEDEEDEDELKLEDYSLEEIEDFMMSEDFDQLDELSKDTLMSYSDKARKSGQKLMRKSDSVSDRTHNAASKMPRRSNVDRAAADSFIKKGDDKADGLHAKSMKRFAGVKKATSRLNNEDIEGLDELSGDTVASYHYKAGRDLAKRGGSSASGPATDADKQKVSARRAGMSRALPRIVRSIRNEDVDANVDEAMDQSKVHPNALHVKPVGGGKYKVHAVGKNFAHGMKAGEHLSDSELDDFAEMGGKVKHVK